MHGEAQLSLSAKSGRSATAAMGLRTSGSVQGADPLPSWNHGAAKQAISACPALIIEERLWMEAALQRCGRRANTPVGGSVMDSLVGFDPTADPTPALSSPIDGVLQGD